MANEKQMPLNRLTLYAFLAFDQCQCYRGRLNYTDVSSVIYGVDVFLCLTVCFEYIISVWCYTRTTL